MIQNILTVIQVVSILATVFLSGWFVAVLQAANRDIKRYRQIEKESKEAIAKYATHE